MLRLLNLLNRGLEACTACKESWQTGKDYTVQGIAFRQIHTAVMKECTGLIIMSYMSKVATYFIVCTYWPTALSILSGSTRWAWLALQGGIHNRI
jgi:hypothetical protein